MQFTRVSKIERAYHFKGSSVEYEMMHDINFLLNRMLHVNVHRC